MKVRVPQEQICEQADIALKRYRIKCGMTVKNLTQKVTQ